ncbi:MAG TPA: glycosyltransferase [Kofleriaceae bacterium]|nr:glycosyltransferase [Kofleriaceae bacterium]
MSNLPIIAFSKDWHEDPTSNHHVLRELAKTRRVLWLNSIATRRPSMTSARDRAKIIRKLSEVARGAVNVENDLWVATPIVLPLPGNAIATAINQRIVRWTIAALRAQLGLDRFHLWTFLPNTGDYVGTLGEDLAVYYCVDEWATFTNLDAEATRRAERRLLEKVDITFATSRALAAAKRAACPHTYHAPHGVDHALFAQALDEATPIPEDLAALPGPRLGFYGTLRDFIDFELIAEVARRRPDWSIALIGQQLCDLSALGDLPNVHLLGQKPHHQLPAYCKGFDVGLIPYRIDDRVRFVNPLKLREYLSAGVPVVATPMEEVQPLAHLCHVAGTAEATVAAIEAALAEGDPAERRARSETMVKETWVGRVRQIARAIDELDLDRHAANALEQDWRRGLVAVGAEA